MKPFLINIAVLLISLSGYACTLCNSKTAKDVRTLVFGEDFYSNLFISILPFIFFAGIIVFIYKGGRTIKL